MRAKSSVICQYRLSGKLLLTHIRKANKMALWQSWQVLFAYKGPSSNKLSRFNNSRVPRRESSTKAKEPFNGKIRL